MPRRNKHTLSYYRLLTGDMGSLYPCGLTEVLPGDSFQHSASIFLRMSPLAAPVMHPIQVRCHHFFTPHRLTWPDDGAGGGWENFITAGEAGDDSQTIPTEALTGVAGDLYDYFALPAVAGVNVSALPVRAFNLIYNEWYRDQDLVTKRLEDNITIPRIAWEKDYWTMARPWPQKGPEVTLPVGTTAPIHTLAADGGDLSIYSEAEADFRKMSVNADGTPLYVHTDVGLEADEMFADLSAAGAVPINEFRRAFALQRYAEARAKYGSRYVEYLRYIGANPADQRIQRPEYLGGGKVRISTSEVLQTSDDAGGPNDRFGVGDLYGHGVAAMRSNSYRRTFQEHGYVMTLLSVRPKAIYTAGAERHWLRRDRNDYWQRELEQIGQQEIWDGELFMEAGDTDTETYNTWGYQDRYREYKESQNRVAGEFRDELDYWHLARQFGSRPALNQSFIECDPSKRIYNVQTNHGLWMAVQHRLVARRFLTRSNASRIM